MDILRERKKFGSSSNVFAVVHAARREWVSQRTEAERKQLDEAGDCKSLRFFVDAQRTAACARYQGRREAFDTLAHLRTIAEVVNAQPEADREAQQLVTACGVPVVSHSAAIEQAECEKAARERIIELLTMPSEGEPPLKQVLDFPSFASVLRSSMNSDRSGDQVRCSSAHTAIERQHCDNTKPPLHQRPLTAQPRPTTAPPLNCFRPWSASPLRPCDKQNVSVSRSRPTSPPPTSASANEPCDSKVESAVNAPLSRTSNQGANSWTTLQASQHLYRLGTSQNGRKVPPLCGSPHALEYEANIAAVELRQKHLDTLLSNIAASRQGWR